MEMQQKKNIWLKKIALFVLICVLLSFIIKGGSQYYFDNYWSPGIENSILQKCIYESRASADGEISDEVITNYCNCNLKKLKAKYKPKEISTINQHEWEAFAQECSGLIK